MSEVVSRFLKYISFDTQSAEEKDAIPSTPGQLVLAGELKKELEEMGARDVVLSASGYVYATIPPTPGWEKAPVLGLIAHMDTSPALTGAGVCPQRVENYQGGDICLNREKDIWLKVSDFPDLEQCLGMDLLTTDGTTLLGADDKAGVAEIMTLAAELLADPQKEHGTIRIAFTPDEEVGRGADAFDVKGFGADLAYTVDGGALGEIEYENFNAASGKVTVNGASIHPGSAKGKMRNALLIAMEFQGLLPVFDNPMYTEGYEGFYHLDQMSGTVEQAFMDYIIRDHDREKFQKKKDFFQKAADFINEKYGPGTMEVRVRDSYYNMKEIIDEHSYLIQMAKDAMEKADIPSKVIPIRGGTDGARLSFMGLPCPNLCTGGYNFHGKYEFIPIQSMEKVVQLLTELVCAPKQWTRYWEGEKQ